MLPGNAENSSQFVDDEAVNESFQTLSILPSVDSCPSSKVEPGSPHEALLLVLAYLPIYELLNMSKVCKLFREAVKEDVLPWLNIIIDRPLNSRLSDEILMKVTSKANCRLRTLILRNCGRITDDGLQRVVQQNPFIGKLHLPGCTSLTPDGIIRAVRTLSQHQNSLKSLQINGIYNLKEQHIETLSSYLQWNTAWQKPKPILYHLYITSPSRMVESDRVIDVDICPRCNEIKMIFECSREACRQKKDQLLADCRGCKFCIPRCELCGGCVDAEELEEAACGDILCSNCWLCLPKCNQCNKPYCKHHINRQFSPPGSAGFICEACLFQATGNSNSSSDGVE